MKPTLLLIDLQAGFRDPSWGVRNNPSLEQNIGSLLARARTEAWGVVHVQHLSTDSRSPLRPGQAGAEFLECARPRDGEPVIQKRVNSAFIGTTLEALLRDQGASKLLFAGLTTDHCVSTSTRMAANLGFECFVAADATATFGRTGFDGTSYPASLVHELALASLHGEFATVLERHEEFF